MSSWGSYTTVRAGLGSESGGGHGNPPRLLHTGRSHGQRTWQAESLGLQVEQEQSNKAQDLSSLFLRGKRCIHLVDVNRKVRAAVSSKERLKNLNYRGSLTHIYMPGIVCPKVTYACISSCMSLVDWALLCANEWYRMYL